MENFLWVERYRPHTVVDCILPNRIKEIFQAFVDEKNVTNLILTGTPGLGKTSVAMAMLEEIGCEYIKINSSLKRGIDIIRDDIARFASTVSFTEGRKYVILDEADGLLSSFQEALKAFIEEYSDNCGFILTCNNLNKIIPAIQSRCSIIDFTITKEDFPILAKEFYLSLVNILDENSITRDDDFKKIVGAVIKKFYPDWRKILITFQDYSIKKKCIDSGILAQKTLDLSELISYLKKKEWNNMRRWVGENSYVTEDYTEFTRTLYKNIQPSLIEACLPMFVDLINEYDFRMAFVVDKETNVVAFLSRLIGELTWK